MFPVLTSRPSSDACSRSSGGTQAEDARWQQTNPEARARAEATIAQLTSSIAKLEAEREKAVAAGRMADVEKADAALEARRQWLAQAESSLQEFS